MRSSVSFRRSSGAWPISMRLVWAHVVTVESVAQGLQRLEVLVEGERAAALCYPQLTGPCTAGDEVLLNTTAVDLDLGTGGAHFVIARAPDASGEVVALDRPSGGHIMKLRYTPLQIDVSTVEEQGGSAHGAMASATDIAGMPVACCGLHSQVPLVAAAVKDADPTITVAYVMTDFAALPLALSDVIRASVEAGLIDSTVTCGQAFGGSYESVNLHSGLLAAKHVAGADIAIVAIGPGVVGTATPFGHGGIAQGEAINAASVLGGRPVAVLRLSSADARERHRPVSHHTTTALTSIALAPAMVAVPSSAEGVSDAEFAEVEAALDRAGVWTRHARQDIAVRAPDMRGVAVTTMGRGPDQDPLFFAAAHAAGALCVTLLGRGPDS